MSLTIGQYLLDRLQNCGVQHIFGVPGDYVLRFNKLIEQHHDIQFINTTRENTAGYAAEAYALLRGLGVACITYGVGINIANALAQAYVENAPLVVISGAAGVEEFKKHSNRHHLINRFVSPSGDRTQFEIFKSLTIDQGILDSPDTAAEIIDRVLTSCLQHKKPVYLEIPRDRVDTPLTIDPLPFSLSPLKSNPSHVKEALKHTQRILSTCRHPIIWAGHELLRFGLHQEILEFAEKHQIPIASSSIGKTIIDERHPLFIGVYRGAMSSKELLETIDACDCLLMFGILLTDFDTGIFTNKFDQKHCIEVNQGTAIIGNTPYTHVLLADYIQGLSTLALLHISPPPYTPKKMLLPDKFEAKPEARTTIKRIFECLQHYLSSDHLVVSDIGDCLFASIDLTLAQNSFLSCCYFASLGFGIPAAIGAQFADPKRRVIAIIGDGGFQMTGMELSTAVRYQLDPVIILLNNHGYSTERPLLEGSYNDIQNWNYTQIPLVLGGGIGIKVKTEQAFENALQQAFINRGTFYLIEVELDKLDFSPSLNKLGELLGKIINHK